MMKSEVMKVKRIHGIGIWNKFGYFIMRRCGTTFNYVPNNTEHVLDEYARITN